MLRAKISNFIKNNKYKIQSVFTKLIMVVIVVAIATIILLSFKNTGDSENEQKNLETYNPKETIIKGKDISEKQYAEDSNIVNKFLEYCNNKEIKKAYDLLSSDCKEELYPTIEEFKDNYYMSIFNKKRDCNIQSWISTSEYNVYKIRYTNNMLSTGTYNKEDVFEDYITLNKNSEKESISIGRFIGCEECNITTNTQDLEITIERKKIYISDEEYEIKIKNKTNNVILLDDLKTDDTIKLIGASGAEYGAYTNKLFITNLKINPNITKNITIRFNKGFSSNNKSEKIRFSNVIRDYNIYIQNIENYNNVANVVIKLEE